MELDKDQQEIYDELLKRYKNIDNQLLPAMTGWGKGRVATNVALQMYKKEKRKVLVLCPKILIPMWEKMLNNLNIPILLICTYNKLPTTNLLIKRNGFRETDYWLKQKVFIICDESQALKNKKSTRHNAFFALIANHPNCKVIHLTACPIDKKENWLSLYRMLGLIKQSIMIKNKNYKDYGLGDLFELASQHHKTIVKDVKEKYTISSPKIPHILSYLWHHLFREMVVIEVKDPIYQYNDKIINHKLCNFFATLDKEGVKLVKEAMIDLGNADIIKDNKVNVTNMRKKFGVVILSLMKLCHAKISTIVRLAIEDMKKKKVIICCPFIDDQLLLCKKLEKYNPLLLNGKVKDRASVVEKFNQPNLDYRCLIMTPEVGGEGISLHDTYGNFPRVTYIIPTYHFLKMFQAAGRTYRRGIKSDTEVYMVYSNDGMVESIIVNLLAKTEIANSILIPGSNRIFPGGWDYVIEDESDKHKELRLKLREEQNKCKI